MPLRADADSRFNFRNLIISIICLAVAIWHGYDALFVFPQKLVHAKAYQKLAELDKKERSIRWREITADKGWPAEVPDKPGQAYTDLVYNYAMAIGGLLIGLFFLVKFYRIRGSWYQLDGQSITNSYGQVVELKDAFQLDKRKWRKKGIARLHYHTDSGATAVMVLDDFKYHRETIGKIVQEVEEHLPPDQVIGGDDNMDGVEARDGVDERDGVDGVENKEAGPT